MDSSTPATEFEDIDGDNMEEEMPPEVNDGEPQTVNQRKRKERSDVWNHFTKLKDNVDKCNCNYCQKVLKCPTCHGTSNLRKPLDNCDKYLETKKDEGQTNLNQEGDGSLKYIRVSEAIFKETSNEMLVLGGLPLSFIEGVAWKHFCNKTKQYKPHSRRTATRDIFKMYVQKKSEMRKMIGSHRVSLTTDIWKNENTGAYYMVITTHWVDDHWTLRKLIIGFKNIADHKGMTIAKILLDCLDDWNIKKVFTITVDNATANTSALRWFKDQFETAGTDSLVLEGEFLHMRCAAHIINLVVKDGLKEADASIEAIRNGITYVRHNDDRLNSFELRVDSSRISRGSLVLDVPTRWNSTFLMLSSGLQFRLAFDKMEAEDKKYNEWFEKK